MPGCDGLPAQARGMGQEPPAWWHATVPTRATPPSACVSAALRTISIHDTSKNKEDGTGVAVLAPVPVLTCRTGAIPQHPSGSPCAWSFFHWVIQKPRSRTSRKMNVLCGEREPCTRVRPVCPFPV